jgi:hypothetical protein
MTRTRRSSRKATAEIPSARWAAYATAGAATALVGVPHAEAQIHHVTVNQVMNATLGSKTFQLTGFDLVPGAYLTFLHAFGPAGGGVAGFYFGSVGAVSAKFIGVPGTYNGLAFHYVGRLNFGDNISLGNFLPVAGRMKYGASNPLASGNGYPKSQWVGVVNGFIGLKFNVGDGTQYGWVQISMDGPKLNSYKVIDFAWADPGQTLVAGQVPEPGSLALLAFGAVGLLLWRQKRGTFA